MSDVIATLNAEHGQPGIRFVAGQGGLTKAVVETALAAGEVYLHGGHITHFQPSGQEPVLWMSQESMFESGKPIRGGIPLCFPWFGPHATQPDAPGHGWARLNAWKVNASSVDPRGLATIELELEQDEFHCLLKMEFGQVLDVELAVRLVSGAREPSKYQVALHSYFAVGDVASISITGLEQADYIDKLDQASRKAATGKAIQFDAECDRIYLDTKATCTLHDPVMSRRIEVAKRGSEHTVVWNPWIAKAARMPDFGNQEWQKMVCIETANVGPEQWLSPGETARIATRIGVSP